MALEYRSIKLEDIVNYCKENKETKWLKEELSRTVDVKVYPKIEKDGKMVTDKKAEPTIEKRPISFIQVKNDFVDKFMPEIKPEKKAGKMTMADILASL